MLLVLCVCLVPGCLGVLDLCMMSVLGLCKPFSLFSSLLRGHHLILIEIALSPLPGH